MKSLLKVAALIAITSGLTACSSAKKQNDSVLAELAEADTTTSIEQTDSGIEEPSEFIEPEEETSLGIGSSGLGH